jgi:uncharacterized protein YbjT (DUF2867 family)
MILVTGASGAIGTGLVGRLLSNGRKLRFASRNPRKPEQRWPDVDALQLDVQDPSTLPRALEAIDVATTWKRDSTSSFRSTTRSWRSEVPTC